MVGQILPRTGRARQPAPPPMTPGERADRLGRDGYTLRRTGELGVYMLTRPDKSRTYRIDANTGTCNCQSTAWWTCKHNLYCQHWFAYDKARLQLATAYQRDLLVHAHEDAFYAAACNLMAVTGLDMWDEMRGWQKTAQGRGVRIGRAA